MAKDEHIVLLNRNIEGLNRNLNEAHQAMKRMFTFGFNTTIGQEKYFFLDCGLNFDFFNPSKLMAKIIARTTGTIVDHT